jgi:hypothetical protein
MSKFLSPVQKGSVDDAISTIRKTRDEFISSLLTEPGLSSFMEHHYDTIYLSPVRTEFLKRDLKELRNSALDLVHYSPLIKDFKEEKISDAKDHRLIIDEVKALYEKYRY